MPILKNCWKNYETLRVYRAIINDGVLYAEGELIFEQSETLEEAAGALKDFFEIENPMSYMPGDPFSDLLKRALYRVDWIQIMNRLAEGTK